MSETAAEQTPVPNPPPAATPTVAPNPNPPIPLSQYLGAWEAKKVRMQQSWRRAALVLTALFVVGLGTTIAVGELQPYFQKGLQFVSDLVQKKGWPGWIPVFVAMFFPAFILIQIIQLVPAVLVWWERKVAAHMQVRLGPMSVGGWHGWAQTIADGIKLFLKEIIEPEGVDKWVFRLAPVIVFLPAYMAFAPLPFGTGLVALDLDIGLLFVLAISGVSTIGILMAGWGSANKYAILGGLRAAAQIVSYEIPRVFSIVPIVMWAGTLSLTQIISHQSVFLGGWFPRWFIFYPVVGQIAFLIYLVTTIAETNRVPFDIPEAESELVAGFHTEYGGMKFAIFFLAEYAYVFVGSVVGTVVFFGGGAPLFPALDIIPSWAWFLAKTGFLIFIFLWARWTLPRLRVDRVMDLCWKFMLPWSLINIVLMGAILLWRIG